MLVGATPSSGGTSDRGLRKPGFWQGSFERLGGITVVLSPPISLSTHPDITDLEQNTAKNIVYNVNLLQTEVVLLAGAALNEAAIECNLPV